MAEAPALTVYFKDHSVPDARASKDAGRPMFKDMPICVIRTPGDKLSEKVFPAHAFAGWRDDGHGGREQYTYAMRFPEQFQRYMEGKTQVQDGTPLEELPFLTASQRMELKALHVYTAEQLAMLEGTNLKALGSKGREWKNQAIAYIDNASGSAKVTAMAAEIEELKRTIAGLTAPAPKEDKPEDSEPATENEAVSEFDDSAFRAGAEAIYEDMSDDDLKEFIKSHTGTKPRGNPSHETLVKMAAELVTEKAA